MLAESFADDDDSADGDDAADGDAADGDAASSLEIAKPMFPESAPRRTLQRAVSIASSCSPSLKFYDLFSPATQKVGTTINASPRPNI